MTLLTKSMQGPSECGRFPDHPSAAQMLYNARLTMPTMIKSIMTKFPQSSDIIVLGRNQLAAVSVLSPPGQAIQYGS